MKRNVTLPAACCAVLLGLLGAATARADDAFCANCYVGLRLGNSLSSLDSNRATSELQQQQGGGLSAELGPGFVNPFDTPRLDADGKSRFVGKG